MDKKLLESLNNLSLALEDIASSLKSKGEAQSATAKAMKGGDFVKEIKEINVGVKQILKDTKQILANQQTIMAMGKKKDKGVDATETLGKDKKKQGFFKQGIGVILLIAVAVLALGVAFKLIGSVNFLAVISLSIALPLLAIAFEKVATVLKKTGFDAKKDGINFVLSMIAVATSVMIASRILALVKPIGILQMISAIFTSAILTVISLKLDKIMIGVAVFDRLRIPAWKVTLALVAIAAGITAASYVLSYIRPITFMQSLTAILIAGMFAVIGYSMHKIGAAVVAFARLNVKPQQLVFVLVAVAAAITASSWILGMIRPLSFGQMITGILIAAMFMIISLKLEKIALGVIAFQRTKVSPFYLILTLVAVAAAITASSWILGMVKPMGFFQFLTALGIAILFALMGYVMDKLALGVAIIGRLLGASRVFLIPLVMIGISIAIALSSHILATTQNIPLLLLLKILVLGVVLAAVTLAMTIPIILVAKFLNTKSLIFGTIAIVVIAAAIAFSSILLGMGEYGNYPGIKWSIGVAASLLAFSIATIGLGYAATLLGPALVAGVAMTLAVALSIMATSLILNEGNYEKFPPLMWVLGTVAAMVPFALIAVALGAIALTGVGLIAFAVGLPMILEVADTIVETSKILSRGKYDNKGMASWAAATALLYATFVPILLILGAVGIAAAVMDFFGPNPWEVAKSMMSEIAWTIVDVSYILAKGNYKDGPTEAWAKGVAIALGAFAPVYQMMMNNAIFEMFGGGDVSPEAFSEAIKVVSKGIVAAAWYFSENSAVFANGPPEAWAKGVGKAIGAFAPVFIALNENTGWFTSGKDVVDDMVYGIRAISYGVIEAADIFAQNKAKFDDGYPSVKWGKGVGAALAAFNPVFKALHEDTGWFTSGTEVVDDMRYGIEQIAWALTTAATAFSYVDKKAWEHHPSTKWAKGVKGSVIGFMDIFDSIYERGYSVSFFTAMTQILTGALNSISFSAWIMYKARKAFTFKIPIDWTKNLGNNVLEFARVAQQLDKILGFDEKIATKSGGVLGYGQTETTTTKRSMKDISIVARIAYQLGQTALILFAHRKAFSFKLPIDWTLNLGTNILTYANLTNDLDKLLGYDEKISSKSGGFVGIGQTTTTTTQRKMKDVSIINRIVNQMITTAIMLDKAKKLFDPKAMVKVLDWTKMMSRSLVMYASLSSQLERVLTIKEVFTTSLGVMKDGKWTETGRVSTEKTRTAEVGIVNRMVNQMVITAGILWMNRKYFSLKLDEDYMRKVKRNIIDFASIVRYLSKDDTLQGGGALKNMLGLDPISNTARGMVKLASAFDTLAKSLNRFSSAIKSIDGSKMTAIRKLTGNIAILSAMDASMFNKLLTVLESKSSVFGKLLDDQTTRSGIGRPSVGDKKDSEKESIWNKNKRDQGPADAKGETALTKLDKVVTLLTQISVNTGTANAYLEEAQSQAKKNAKSGKRSASDGKTG